jgi:hypothetical protein
MATNHGVAYMGQSKVRTWRAILKVISTNICGSDQHLARCRATASRGLVNSNDPSYPHRHLRATFSIETPSARNRTTASRSKIRPGHQSHFRFSCRIPWRNNFR